VTASGTSSEPARESPSPVQFQINAPGVDVEALVHEIRETVARKTAAGAYTDARIARAERTNLATLARDEEFLDLYLESLREAVFVDITDFEIRERRKRFAKPLVAFKKTLWKLLRFYTYRLWSQQNQVNGLLLSALEELDRKHMEKTRKLEERVAQLEARLKQG
jgi:hypothetical protein